MRNSLVFGTPFRLAVLLVGLFPAGTAVLAQAPAGRIVGVVKDPSGAVVPGGQVLIKSLDSGVATSAVADREGRFAFERVPVGRYQASAAFTGFATSVRNDVTVTAGQDAST